MVVETEVLSNSDHYPLSVSWSMWRQIAFYMDMVSFWFLIAVEFDLDGEDVLIAGVFRLFHSYSKYITRLVVG